MSPQADSESAPPPAAVGASPAGDSEWPQCINITSSNLVEKPDGVEVRISDTLVTLLPVPTLLTLH